MPHIRTTFLLVSLLSVASCGKSEQGSDFWFLVLAGESHSSEKPLSPLRTYQSQCLDGIGAVIACSGTGQDAEYRAGRDVALIDPEFNMAYPDEHTTRDSTTGLVWKTCSEGQSGADCSTGTALRMDWATASGIGTGCNALNSLNGGSGYGGRTDWRLPAIEEMETTIHYASSTPTVFSGYFPATIGSHYWSTSPYSQDLTGAWFVFYNTGAVSISGKGTLYYVRCVAGQQFEPEPLYSDSGNDTITDQATGLVWQKCSAGQSGANCSSGSAEKSSWVDALAYCNGLSIGGRSWRLPNINELKTIVDRKKIVAGSIDSAHFPAVGTAGYYWSASTYVSTPSDAWLVGFSIGDVVKLDKTTLGYVRCVSAGL